MKEKGFTLIELLAVIVILAIIALIAVPIVLNIIEDSRGSSNKRSVELYAKAVENAVGRYQMDHPEDTEITFKKLDDEKLIEYKGNTVNCDVTTINSDGTIYLTGCKVNNEPVEYVYGKLSTNDDSTNKLCTLVEGTSKAVGSKYNCSLDENRIFYVLQNNPESAKITLIMDRNYVDNDVPQIADCNYSDENNGLNQYVDKIQTRFGNSVVVGIPSVSEIEGTGCEQYSSSCPSFIYENLNEDKVNGYWTSTAPSGSPVPHYVIYGELTNSMGYEQHGVRPTITVLKSDLS